MGRQYDFAKTEKHSVKYDKQESVRVEAVTTESNRYKEWPKDQKRIYVSALGLFRFSDHLDKLLMVVGLLGGIGHGLGQQINLLILAEIIDQFTEATTVVNGNTEVDTDMPNDPVPTIVFRYSMTAIYIMLCGYLNMMCWCMTSERQVKVIRDKAFRGVLRQHMGWFDKHQSGEINTRLTSDIYNIQAGIGDKVATFVQWTAAFVTGAIMCLVRDWKLTLAILACTPVGLVLATIVGKLLQGYARKELSLNAGAGALAGEVLSNIRTVTAYGGQAKEAARYKDFLVKSRAIGIKRGLVNGLGQGLFWLIVFATISFGFWFGAYLNRTEGHPTVGIVIQIVVSLVGATRSLSFAVGNLDHFTMARGGASVIFSLIDNKSEIDSSLETGEKPAKSEGNICFRGLRFTYPSRPDGTILNNLNLELLPGQTVALVGSSGSGKSTIVQLIQRLYDPDIGEVTYDGRDLRTLNIRWLRQQIGVVSQEPVLFATTIRENIMFGRDGVTQEQVEQAAREANAHSFILELPDKYDTTVGTKGTQMSGGQKQRIAIARALIRNPKVLLLDDATSALDYQSESVVQEALDKARQGRTTLIVAHRLSTVRNADLICVLDRGHIQEMGTHDQLLESGGRYAKLVSRQTAGSDSDEEERDINDLYDMDDIDLEDTEIHGTLDRKISELTARSSTRSRSSTRGTSLRRRRKTTRTESTKEEPLLEVKQPEPAPLSRIIALNFPELPLIIIGCFSAAIQGAIFPTLAYFSAEILAAFSLSDEEMKRKINGYSIFLASCGVGAAIATFLMLFMFNISGERLTLRLRKKAFEAMLRQEVGWFDDRLNQVGTLTTRLATDAAMVKAATGAHLSTVINAFATVLLSLILAFLFSWQVTLICSAFIPLLIATGIVQSAMLVGFARAGKQSMEEGGKLISEAVDNVRTVASLTKEPHFQQKYNEHFEKAFKQGKKRAHVFGVTWGVSQSVFTFAYAATFGYGAYLIGQGQVEFQDVFRVFVAIANGAVELGRINAFAADYTKAKVSAAKLFALFERQSKIDPTNETGERPAGCQGKVEFQSVAFRYPTRPDAQVLKDLTVSIMPGQVLALVGASGCGKSTSIQMLERFYDPEKGTVRLDGHNTRQLNLAWLRRQLGIVAQEPMLFETTIRENIAYGDQSRDIPMVEIIEAARQANIHEFVTSLGNGYDTELGSKGVQLVGGQKQRIAIARALVRNPKILLLDEATSALDTENEMVVQEALDRAQEGRTCIVIAHRLSTIENADVIAVIDQGRVVELGPHAELLAQRGLYFELQMIQRGVKKEDS